MSRLEIIDWLLEGDPAIQYQTYRDLLGMSKPHIRQRISQEGWGKRFLSYRHKNGHWGKGFYQPKWISTHYTLLDLKNLQIDPKILSIRESIRLILDHEIGEDGGINPSKAISQSDVCINGMFLNYACYFNIKPNKLNK